MSWAKLDDRFHRHRKVDGVSLDAVGLWTKALSYCADYLTDGFVDERWVQRELPNKKRRERIVGELIAAGLFEVCEGGCRLHDYLHYNDSREDVLARRERERAKKRKQAERARGFRADPNEDSLGEGSGDSLYPDPSRPGLPRLCGGVWGA